MYPAIPICFYHARVYLFIAHAWFIVCAQSFWDYVGFSRVLDRIRGKSFVAHEILLRL